MTLAQARNLLDILVDKANNPYFTSGEKDEFLELALTEFITKYYAVYDINEQARAALKGLIKSETPTSGSSAYALPDSMIYILSVLVQYNAPNDVNDVLNPFRMAKQVPVADFSSQADPFNKPSYEDPIYTYTGTSSAGTVIVVSPSIFIDKMTIRYLARPTLSNVFSSSPKIEETHQHEVVQIAARKMLANIESPNYEVQSQEAE